MRYPLQVHTPLNSDGQRLPRRFILTYTLKRLPTRGPSDPLTRQSILVPQHRSKRYTVQPARYPRARLVHADLRAGRKRKARRTLRMVRHTSISGAGPLTMLSEPGDGSDPAFLQ